MQQSFIFFIFLLIFIPHKTFSQGKPLTGSGKMSNISFTQSGYDKLNFLDFEGSIEVNIGKAHHVHIQIDDNLAKLVTFDLDKKENELTVSIRDNKNGRLYLENISAKIVITMPEASVIKHRGNSHIIVTGIVGRYFRMEQQGNGDANISGSIDELDISKIGNGSVWAENLPCKTAYVNTVGNGNVKINASESFSAKGAGNGNVIQIGKGKSKIFSGLVGNGKIIKSNP